MKSYPEWDMNMPTISPRSRFYRLKPVGVGTPLVESLTSYIARLAETHHITPKVLVRDEIFPFQGKEPSTWGFYSQLGAFWKRDHSSINGVSQIAQEWVETLATLTCRNNLSFLTMLRWQEVVSANRLMRRNKAWCPQCFAEWMDRNQIIYEPLLWMLRDIDTCLEHQQPLVMVCPQCKKPLPILMQISRLGYCPYCACWLGNSQASANNAAPLSSDFYDYSSRHWKTIAVGQLLTAAPNLAENPTKTNVALVIKYYLTKHTDGNKQALARFLGLPYSSFEGILAGRQHDFSVLLRLCSLLSITPLALLTGNITQTERLSLLRQDKKTGGSDLRDTIPLTARPRKGSRLTDEEIKNLRRVMEVAAEDTHLSMNLTQIVQIVGRDYDTIRRHCPDLYQIIANRFGLQDDTLSSIQEALEHALTSDEKLPLQALANRLGYERKVLMYYFPDLCRALTNRYRQRHDYDRIQQQLEEILHKADLLPSAKRIAQQVGCEIGVIRSHFPDLYKRMVALRRAEKSKSHDERVSSICAEASQIIRRLHQQGLYPGFKLIAKELSNPQLIRMKEVQDLRQKMLKELGYI